MFEAGRCRSGLHSAGTVPLGYLLGSIPFGLLLTRFAGLGDIRAIGSGNIGATNVLRTGRKGLAGATLLLDGLKGTAAVLIGVALGVIWCARRGARCLSRPLLPRLAEIQGRQRRRHIPRSSRRPFLAEHDRHCAHLDRDCGGDPIFLALSAHRQHGGADRASPFRAIGGGLARRNNGYAHLDTASVELGTPDGGNGIEDRPIRIARCRLLSPRSCFDPLATENGRAHRGGRRQPFQTSSA